MALRTQELATHSARLEALLEISCQLSRIQSLDSLLRTPWAFVLWTAMD